MIRPIPEFDNAGGYVPPERSHDSEILMRETAREIVKLSPKLAAILCQGSTKKLTKIALEKEVSGG